MLLFLFSSCSKGGVKRYEEERFLFGTYIKMIVYEKTEKIAKEIMDSGFNEIERIDKKFNSKDPKSIISQLNNSKEKKIKIDDETKYLLEQAKYAYDLTKGKFDITMYPLVEVWGFMDEEYRKTIPTEEELKEAKKLINFSKVKIMNGNLELLEPIKEIDTGAFLKGYAVEKAKEKMVDKGLKSGFVSSISSIATIGIKPDGTPWRVGIQDPENPEKILGIIDLNDESMGVSGDYQTYVEIAGKRYHHILDKDTGFPVQDKKMVVVVNKNGLMADLLSTALFLMKPKEILEYTNKDKNIKIIMVLSDNSLLKTENIKLKNK
ncbi:MAG: FAD:protein FMN transferase [Fusobacteriaceae bacterium]